MGKGSGIGIEGLGHVGIRVRDRAISVAFYAALGFEETAFYEGPKVSVLRHASGLELNLIVNANDAADSGNVLMDVDAKHPGITHVAFRVDSLDETVRALAEAGIAISEGPIPLGKGYRALFIRDPDRNVVELGRPD